MSTVIAPTTRNRAKAVQTLRQRRAEKAGPIERRVTTPTFSDFKRRVYPRFIPTNFHALLDSYLEQVAQYVETGGK